MKFIKVPGGTYKAIQEDKDIERVDDIFSTIFEKSLDDLNPHFIFVKKKSIFVDILVDTFVSEIGIKNKMVIKTTGTYDVDIFIMKSDVKEIPGMTFSFE